MARNGSNYDTEMPRVFQKLIIEEYYDEGIRTMARTHVIRELQKKEFYTCSFPARELSQTKAGRKQWKFSYLDGSQSQILIARTVITDVYTAEYDPLTGLYNRQAFYRHVRVILDASQERRFVMLRCDIDRFKAYNDMYGAQAGDRLLASFGREIRRHIWPETAVFGHINADHFVPCCHWRSFLLQNGETVMHVG